MKLRLYFESSDLFLGASDRDYRLLRTVNGLGLLVPQLLTDLLGKGLGGLQYDVTKTSDFWTCKLEESSL